MRELEPVVPISAIDSLLLHATALLGVNYREEPDGYSRGAHCSNNISRVCQHWLVFCRCPVCTMNRYFRFFLDIVLFRYFIRTRIFINFDKFGTVLFSQVDFGSLYQSMMLYYLRSTIIALGPSWSCKIWVRLSCLAAPLKVVWWNPLVLRL